MYKCFEGDPRALSPMPRSLARCVRAEVDKARRTSKHRARAHLGYAKAAVHERQVQSVQRNIDQVDRFERSGRCDIRNAELGRFLIKEAMASLVLQFEDLTLSPDAGWEVESWD